MRRENLNQVKRFPYFKYKRSNICCRLGNQQNLSISIDGFMIRGSRGGVAYSCTGSVQDSDVFLHVLFFG